MSGEDRRQPVAKFSAPRPPAPVRERERQSGDLGDDATALADAVFRAEPVKRHRAAASPRRRRSRVLRLRAPRSRARPPIRPQ